MPSLSAILLAMLENIIFGFSLAFAAVIQPGPLQAFLISRVAATGWRRTLPASLAPLISDAPIAILVLVVLGRLPEMAQHGLRAAGGVLLLYLAWGAFRQWRHPVEADEQPSAPRTLFEAVLVNLLNPSPYLGWALVMGPSAVAAWQVRPVHAVALVGSFYITIVAGMALFILLIGTASFLGGRGQRALLGVSSLALAALGLFLLLTELRYFAPA